MQPRYDLQQAARSANAAWRGRVWKLTDPQLVVAGLFSLISVAEHPLPALLRGLLLLPVLGCLCPLLSAVASVMTATVCIPVSPTTYAERPMWREVVRLPGFRGLVFGYAVRLVLTLLLATLVTAVMLGAGAFLLGMLLGPHKLHRTPPPLFNFLLLEFLLLIWYLVLSPYLLALPMFAIARGTVHSMFKASSQFTAGSRGVMASVAVAEYCCYAVPYALFHFLTPGLGAKSWQAVLFRIPVNLLSAFGLSWFLALRTALAWQVSGLEVPETSGGEYEPAASLG